VISHHPGHDRGHRRPGAAQQPGDGGLVGALGQPGDDVLDVAGEPGTGAGPWHRLGPHPAAASAGQPADLGLQVQPGGAQVQVPPAAHRAVIDRPGGPAAGAVQAATSAAQADDDPTWGEHHRGHVGAGDGEHLVACGSGAHASLRRVGWLGSSEPTKDGACASSTAAWPSRTPYRSSQPGLFRPHPTHTKPRSPRKLRVSFRSSLTLWAQRDRGAICRQTPGLATLTPYPDSGRVPTRRICAASATATEEPSAGRLAWIYRSLRMR
jgi:hypothetical protein